MHLKNNLTSTLIKSSQVLVAFCKIQPISSEYNPIQSNQLSILEKISRFLAFRAQNCYDERDLSSMLGEEDQRVHTPYAAPRRRRTDRGSAVVLYTARSTRSWSVRGVLLFSLRRPITRTPLSEETPVTIGTSEQAACRCCSLEWNRSRRPGTSKCNSISRYIIATTTAAHVIDTDSHWHSVGNALGGTSRVWFAVYLSSAVDFGEIVLGAYAKFCYRFRSWSNRNFNILSFLYVIILSNRYLSIISWDG